ncbi:hypothetical protein L9F63_010702, partial [Diploptera punctata]
TILQTTTTHDRQNHGRWTSRRVFLISTVFKHDNLHHINHRIYACRLVSHNMGNLVAVRSFKGFLGLTSHGGLEKDVNSIYDFLVDSRYFERAFNFNDNSVSGLLLTPQNQ